MKKIALFASTAAMLAFPLAASAHQHASYLIGGTQYEFVVGSLNEPIAVDDKTGVDFRVTSNEKPVLGLEKDLKVELIAGEKKKTLELSPVYNTPGSYKASFYPTVATTLAYRIFGTINDTPVDITFTCRAEGATTEDEGEKEISSGVKQLTKGGGFGCPQAKESLGFPEASASVVSTDQKAAGANTMSVAGVGLGVVALVLAGIALRRKS